MKKFHPGQPEKRAKLSVISLSRCPWTKYSRWFTAGVKPNSGYACILSTLFDLSQGHSYVAPSSTPPPPFSPFSSTPQTEKSQLDHQSRQLCLHGLGQRCQRGPQCQSHPSHPPAHLRSTPRHGHQENIPHPDLHGQGPNNRHTTYRTSRQGNQDRHGVHRHHCSQVR